MVEYLHLWDTLEAVQLHAEQEDAVRWRWTADGQYTAKSAYQMLHKGRTSLQGAELIWKTWAPLRVKLFLWLACRRRILTADRRRRRGLEAHDTCFMCDQSNETADHLLASCSVAKEVWWLAFSWAQCQCSFTGPEMTIQDWWEHPGPKCLPCGAL